MSLVAHSDHGVRRLAAAALDGPLLSYHATVLYPCDAATLATGVWLNDNIVSWWWEHLAHEEYRSSTEYVFMHPGAVAMCLHLGSGPYADPDDLFESLNGLALGERSLIFMPINDNLEPERVLGGSHWSLLVYSRRDARFFHYDSSGSPPSNRSVALRVATAVWAVMLRGDHAVSTSAMPAIDEPRLQPASNSSDCGVYVTFIANLLCLVGGSVIDVYPLVAPKDVASYREHMRVVLERMAEEYAQLENRTLLGRKLDVEAIRPAASKANNAPRAEDLPDVPLRDALGRIVDMNEGDERRSSRPTSRAGNTLSTGGAGGGGGTVTLGAVADSPRRWKRHDGTY